MPMGIMFPGIEGPPDTSVDETVNPALSASIKDI
jgi:hypothetical protein